MAEEGYVQSVNIYELNKSNPKIVSYKTVPSLYSFPDLDYSDIKHHKIVKKQMNTVCNVKDSNSINADCTSTIKSYQVKVRLTNNL